MSWRRRNGTALSSNFSICRKHDIVLLSTLSPKPTGLVSPLDLAILEPIGASFLNSISVLVLDMINVLIKRHSEQNVDENNTEGFPHTSAESMFGLHASGELFRIGMHKF